MMVIPPLAPLVPVSTPPSVTPTAASSPAPGFGDAMTRGLQQVSGLEHRADALIQDVASGGPTKVHEVMVATTESSLAIDMLVQVRDKALEAYHDVMRLQL